MDERKSVTLELKAEAEGAFTARIATLDVIDHDGDVIRPGSFPEGKELLVSAYQHASWQGALPVGIATVSEKDRKDVVADGIFNLKTTGGRDTYEAVKFTGARQEWSFGFRVLAQGAETDVDAYAKDHDGARPSRIITKVDPYEISPVLLGAGIGTATLGIKGLTYDDQSEAALAAVEALVVRTKSLADLRRSEGRDLSEPKKQRIEHWLSRLSELQADLKGLLESGDGNDKAAAVFLEFSRINARIMEEL